MEAKAAVDSGVCVVAKHAGVVERSASNRDHHPSVRMERKDVYQSDQVRSEATRATATTRARSYIKGDRVEAGEVIADGPSTIKRRDRTW